MVGKKADGPAYPIESVARALEILLLLRDRATIGVTEASRQLSVARSTAHRLLGMLEHYGFAQRDTGSRAYRPGPALISLGLSAVLNLDIRRRAQPHMEKLALQLQETVNLIGLEDANVRFLECAEGPQAIRVAARTGLSRPAHCTSAGKAILAELSRVEFDQLYPDEELPGLTPKSITKRSELLAVLDDVRRQGYATNLGESDTGLRAVGVAIPDVFGPPKAGLGVSAPASRLSSATKIEEVARAAQQAAKVIAASFD